MRKVDHSSRLEQYLEKVSQCSPEGSDAVEYVRAHRTKVIVGWTQKGVGAIWTPFANIRLNSSRFTIESILNNPRAWALLIHEVKHLQQGWLTALSVYGELEAWQLDFRVYYGLVHETPHPLIAEMMSLPLNWDRSVLRRAQDIMDEYAGKDYGAHTVPLYPLHHEINYMLFHKRPSSKNV